MCGVVFDLHCVVISAMHVRVCACVYVCVVYVCMCVYVCDRFADAEDRWGSPLRQAEGTDLPLCHASKDAKGGLGLPSMATFHLALSAGKLARLTHSRDLVLSRLATKSTKHQSDMNFRSAKAVLETGTPA